MASWNRTLAVAGLGLMVRGVLLAAVMLWTPAAGAPWLQLLAAGLAAWSGAHLGTRWLGGPGPGGAAAAGVLVGLAAGADLLTRRPMSEMSTFLPVAALAGIAIALAGIGGWLGGARRITGSMPVPVPDGSMPDFLEGDPTISARLWYPRPEPRDPEEEAALRAARQQGGAPPLPTAGAGWLALGAGLSAVSGVAVYLAAQSLILRPFWATGIILAVSAPLAGGALGSWWARRTALPQSSDAPVLAALAYGVSVHVLPELARLQADRTFSPGFFAAALAPGVVAAVGALLAAAAPPHPPDMGRRAPHRRGLLWSALAGCLVAGAAAMWGYGQTGAHYWALSALVVSAVAGLALGGIAALLAVLTVPLRSGAAAAGLLRWAAYLAAAGVAAAVAGVAVWVLAGAPWFP